MVIVVAGSYFIAHNSVMVVVVGIRVVIRIVVNSCGLFSFIN